MKLKHLLKIITLAYGITILATGIYMLVFTFYAASYNGLFGSGYQVLEVTNAYGENWIEVAWLVGSIPAVAYVFYQLIGLYFKTIKEEQVG